MKQQRGTAAITIALLIGALAVTPGNAQGRCWSSLTCGGALVFMDGSLRDCCLGTSNGRTYDTGGEACRACIVFGWITGNFSGVERGQPYPIEVGFIKGGMFGGDMLRFNVTVIQGSATQGTNPDFTASNLEDIRPQGNSVVTVTVTLREDSVALEQEETFQLRLIPLDELSMAMGTNAFLINTIEVTIIDQDVATVQFEQNEYTVVEGEVVEVCVIKDIETAIPTTVNLITEDESAESPVDYSGGTFTAEFGTEAGARFCQNIQTVADTDTEPVNETFLVNITIFPGSPLQIGTPGITRVFITVATFDLIANPANISEGNFGTPIIISLVSGSSRPLTDVTINFTVSGTATAGEDYEVPGPFTYTNLGSNDQMFNLVISEDSIAELTETIILQAFVSNGSAQFFVDTVTIILNDDDVATFDLIANPANISEGNFGTPIIISLVSGSSRPLTDVAINFTVSGTATAGEDYEVPGPFTYTTLGSNDQMFNLVISEDSIAELTETIILQAFVSNGSAQFSVDTVTIILNDDDVPFFELRTTNVIEDVGSAVVVVELRVAEIAFDLEVTFQTVRAATAPSPATEGDDYTATTVVLTFLSGDMEGETRNVNIPIVDDILVENTEVFDVELLVNGTTPPAATLTIAIIDNDDVGGIEVNDTAIGDPLLTVPIYVPNSRFDQISLCYEIHGQENEYFNFISDECASVNAHYGKATEKLNVVDEIAIRAVDNLNECRNIFVKLGDTCSVQIDEAPFTGFSYSNQGISVRRFRSRVRVSVPNCEELTLVMWIFCETRALKGTGDVADIKFVVMRGLNFGHRNAHGLIGQFWNQPVTLTKFTGLLIDGTQVDDRYIINFTRPGSEPRVFTGFFYPVTWDFKEGPCLYVGNRQAGPIAEVDDPNDSVVEGTYSDYVVAGAFVTDFEFGLFNEDQCGTDNV